MKKQNLISAIALATLMCSCGGSLSNNGSFDPSSSSNVSGSDNVSGSGNVSKKKVSLNELSDYAVDIAGAKAFGIKNANNRSKGKRYANSDSNETLLVMTSEYYSDSKESVDSSGNVPVSFVKTIVTDDANEVTTTESFSINYQDYDINILKITSDGIYIPKSSDRQYMISIGTRSTDWMNGESVSIKISDEDENETECLFLAYTDYDSSICTITSRNMDASYSFFSLEGDRYSIIDKDGNAIYTDIVDNDLNDLEKQTGKIKVSGLVEGEEYTLKQVGIRYKETISQDDIDGKIDKLYVNGDYTFVSFVPKEKGLFYTSFSSSMYYVDFGSRPEENELTYDTDGISTYDKCDYFSDSNRKSFIVDNRTGLIYLIEGFNISSIKRNLLYTEEKGKENLVFDIRVNDNKELEIYPLFTNSSIRVYDAFKDKYGNAYVWNDKVNEYDENNKTLYYVFSKGNETAIKDIFYALNENKETVKMKIDNSSLRDLKLIDENGNEKDITPSDSFFMKDTLSSWNVENSYTGQINYNGIMPFKVQNGVAYSFGWPPDPTKNFSYNHGGPFTSFDCTYKTQNCLNNALNGYLNFKFLERYDILLILEKDGNLYSFSGFFEHFDDLYDSDKSMHALRNENLEILEKKKILESCEMDANIGNIVSHGLNADIYYEFYVEYVNGKPVIEAYKGNRTEEVEIVKLQPINL